MQRVLIVLVITVCIGAGYLYLDRMKTEPQQPTVVQPPVPPAPEVTQPKEEVAVTEAIATEARQHINQITAPPETSIAIEQADHFVTSSQLIQIPDKQAASEAAVEVVTQNQESGAQTFAIDTSDLAPSVVTPGEIPVNATKVVIPEGNKIKLQELLDVPSPTEKQVYYIHAVNDGDEQGLWGILQSGLTRTFAEGIQLTDKKEKLYATIPELADEKIDGVRSSFLGRLLQEKVSTTYIYNYRSGYLGDDPNLILPDQQLIIVSFSENELIRVYNHFVNL